MIKLLVEKVCVLKDIMFIRQLKPRRHLML